ncbi:MAG: Ribosomal protein S4E [Candidatus Methanohalarchaeum thermophilum]|uniref:Small ribosomal subunit protein eS4 n=1 Tax=Methanohalarchaeum thermophilum TaxID=1903181 RepID=A0A1Q6DX36_METT1|nr:MAG: Ribosomal protein S4E [Candidatus Methanohalarchaeum thermophilum]
MHQKRISAPRSWKVSNKEDFWVSSPNTPHPKERSMPLNVVLRDVIGIVDNTREVKRILSREDLKIDGRVVKDHEFGVGLFDVISIPKSDFYVRVSMDSKNKLSFIEITEEESKYKVCKITDKKHVPGGNIQLNLHDGKNIRLEETELKPKNSVKIKLPSQEIEKSISFEEGKLAFVFAGQHSGELAEIKAYEVMKGSKSNTVILENEKEFSTIEDYIIIVGDQEPEVTVSD